MKCLAENSRHNTLGGARCSNMHATCRAMVNPVLHGQTMMMRGAVPTPDGSFAGVVCCSLIGATLLFVCICGCSCACRTYPTMTYQTPCQFCPATCAFST